LVADTQTTLMAQFRINQADRLLLAGLSDQDDARSLQPAPST
jgi:hypothetical protein